MVEIKDEKSGMPISLKIDFIIYVKNIFRKEPGGILNRTGCEIGLTNGDRITTVETYKEVLKILGSVNEQGFMQG